MRERASRPRKVSHHHGVVVLAAFGVLATLAVYDLGGSAQPRLVEAGITAGNGPGQLRALPANWSGGEPAVTASERRWLAAGWVPPRAGPDQQLVSRALVDLDLLQQPDGAVPAAWYGRWRYAWPRDDSWAAAALAVTGHRTAALAVLRFLARVEESDGTFQARYLLAGSPVLDGRAAQLDATGWFPWAAYVWFATARHPSRADLGDARALWPAVARSAAAARRALDSSGLPGPASDYWEEAPGGSVTIGTVGPLLTGLRSAADLAAALGYRPDATQWADAAAQLRRAVLRSFLPSCYGRTPGGGADSALTWLGRPFGSGLPRLGHCVADAWQALRRPNGGVAPGQDFPGAGSGSTWTAETAFFALYYAASGQQARAEPVLAWLRGHRTSAGEIPEQVSSTGKPATVAPLAWTDAVVILTLAAEYHRIPDPS